MEKYDVVIVGGGPAGSTCAWQLRNAGFDVAVLDKAVFPRDKVCAGWITPEVVTALELDTVAYARSRVLQPVTGFRTGILGGRSIETRYDAPVSYGIRRCEFDDYLLRRCGAALKLGKKILSIERRDDAWIVDGAIMAPMLVGAGGHACPVARAFGMVAGAPEGRELVVAAQEIECEMDASQRSRCAVQAETPELYFCPDLRGYAWCFRKGPFLNVGEGREDDRQVSAHVAAFGELMKREARIPSDVPTRFHGHAYILYGRSRRELAHDGVLLIGDAAGLAYEASGEGIRPAVESAIFAASVILAARKDYRRDNLGEYCRAIARRFGRRGSQSKRASVAPGSVKQAVFPWLMASKWFARHVIINRWFLHANVAALSGRRGDVERTRS